MIAELWDYWTTKTDRRSRRLGYLYQSIALKHRAKRCLHQWKPHLWACKGEIEKAIAKAREKYPERRSVAVLGSADMNEVPLSLLENSFDEIFLFDVVHSKEMRMLAKEHPKVHLIEKDLSGLPTNLEALSPSDEVRTPDLFDIPPALVISANLLSQIHRVPCEYLEKKGWAGEDVSLMAWKIQKAHLNGLRRMNCSVLLYSDYRLEYLNSKDQVTEVHDTIAPDVLPSFQHRWLWDIAPIPEYSSEMGLRMRVFSSFFPGPELRRKPDRDNTLTK